MKTRSSTRTKLLPSPKTTEEDEVPRKRAKYAQRGIKIQEDTEEMEVDDVPDTTSSTSILYTAIQNQDTKLVGYFLKKKIDINVIDDSSEPFLHLAIKSKNLEIIEMLIDHEADICILYEGKTALHLAVEQGDKEIIEILLKTKKNKRKVNVRTSEHGTPLHMSIKSGNFKVFQLLINSGACIKKIARENIPLYYAAKNNAYQIAEYLINQGANVDTFIRNKLSPFNRCTPLHIAITAESVEVVQLLIKNRAEVNIKTNWGKRPLDLAIETGNYRLFQLLVDAGATIDLSYRNILRFHWAAYHNSLEIAQYLFDKGDNLNFHCPYSWSQFYQFTPLHIALQRENEQVAKFLIEKKAPGNLIGKEGQTPLTIAIEKNNFELFQLLWNPEVENLNSPHTVLPLHQAIAVNNDFAIHFLIEFGVNINAICEFKVSNYSNCTPLQIAVAEGNLAVVELLLEKKVNVNKCTNTMGTPLAVAIDHGNYKLYNLLLKAGASINKSMNMTLLHRSVNVNNYRITQDLIQRGLDVNAINESTDSEYYRCSPLHIAVMKENTKIVKLLIKEKSKVDDEKFIKTPLGIACQQGNHKLVEILVNAGANVNAISVKGTPLYWAVSKGNCEIVEYLIKHQAKVNVICEEVTPLYRAVETGNEKMVELLLKNGALVNWSVQRSGETILMLATKNSNFELVKILINAGADFATTSAKIYSPLHWAVEVNNFSMTQFLIERGSEVNSICLNKTPLYIAVDNGNKEIVELLIKNGATINNKINNLTLLSLACLKGHFDLVKSLVHFGADVNADATPLYWAVETKNYQITQYLITHGIKNIDTSLNDKTPLHVAIENHDIDIVKLLLKFGANTSCRYKSETSLGIAIRKSNLKIIELILQSSSTDINGICDDFRTPAEKAVQYNNTNLMELFLNHQVNINFQISKPKQWFISYVGNHGSIEMLELLIKDNVDINYRDPSSNETFLHFAIKQRSLQKAQSIILREDFISINALAYGESALDVAVKNQYHDESLIDLLLNSGIEVNVGQNKTPTCSSVKKHITKLSAIGRTLSNQNLRAINFNNDWHTLYIECLKEIELTKNAKIDGTKLSYYDILHLNHHNIAIRLNNVTIKKRDEKEIQKDFPLYGPMICFNLIKAYQRKKLLDKSTEVLSRKLLYRILPIDVIREINIYLNNKDLKMLSLCNGK